MVLWRGYRMGPVAIFVLLASAGRAQGAASESWVDPLTELFGIIGWFVGFPMLAMGAMFGILLLVRHGPRTLIGYEQIVVPTFETVALYENGAFQRLLPPGKHWVRTLHVRAIRMDTRSRVLVIAQNTMTADGIPVLLRCAIRVQIDNPSAAIENTADWISEIYANLHSIVRRTARERTIMQLQSRQDDFNEAVRVLAAADGAKSGVACLSAELLQVERASQNSDPESKEIGFRTH